MTFTLSRCISLLLSSCCVHWFHNFKMHRVLLVLSVFTYRLGLLIPYYHMWRTLLSDPFYWVHLSQHYHSFHLCKIAQRTWSVSVFVPNTILWKLCALRTPLLFNRYNTFYCPALRDSPGKFVVYKITEQFTAINNLSKTDINPIASFY